MAIDEPATALTTAPGPRGEPWQHGPWVWPGLPHLALSPASSRPRGHGSVSAWARVCVEVGASNQL
eukprot:7843685-Alexandrium_andersonii.AAC.1